MVRARPLPRLLGRLILAGLLFSSAAHAGEGRVVAIDLEPRVADALVVALSPWSLAVVRTPGPSPAADIDAASTRARAVAAEQHAGAVVWITPPRKPSEHSSLWVYEAQTMALAVRPLTVSAPFDDAGAAAVALSVKTILRASPLVGPEPSEDTAPKRGPSAVAPTPTPTSAPAPAPAPTSAPTPTPTPTLARAPTPTPAPTLAPPPPPTPPPTPTPTPEPSHETVTEAPPRPTRDSRRTWRIETVIGARSPTGASVTLEPRVAVGASLWLAGRAGLGLQLQAGPGVTVNTSAFQGQLREGAAELTARVRVPGDRWLAFEFQSGPSLVLSALDGQALATGAPLHALRLDPAVNAGAIVDFTPGANISVGLIFDASALLRFQRYALDGTPLLTEPGFVMLSGLRLTVQVD